jgi:hypothetical protein
VIEVFLLDLKNELRKILNRENIEKMELESSKETPEIEKP